MIIRWNRHCIYLRDFLMLFSCVIFAVCGGVMIIRRFGGCVPFQTPSPNRNKYFLARDRRTTLYPARSQRDYSRP